METQLTKITLTELEVDVLKKCAARTFNPDGVDINEQDAYIALLEKAENYEADNGLVNERLDFTPDCNLLVWFWAKYAAQEGLEAITEEAEDASGMMSMSDAQ